MFSMFNIIEMAMLIVYWIDGIHKYATGLLLFLVLHVL